MERERRRPLGVGLRREDQRARLYELLSSIQTPSNRLIGRAPNEQEAATLRAYETFLRLFETILAERRSTVLPKQATVFTTNYDVFLDVAAGACPGVALAAGFDGATSMDGAAEYSSGRFFRTTYDTGNLYDYRVELPSINLVKLHGCLSWQRDGERIVRRAVNCELLDDPGEIARVEAFVGRYAIVLPQADKLRATVLDRTYYKLLRLYANALDRANVLLVVFGFSFRDEHILHITRRALKNPTLRLIVFAHDGEDRQFFEQSFVANNNALIVAAAERGLVDFERFNAVIGEAVPKPEERPSSNVFWRSCVRRTPTSWPAAVNRWSSSPTAWAASSYTIP